jgi:hypothetical protein
MLIEPGGAVIGRIARGCELFGLEDLAPVVVATVGADGVRKLELLALAAGGKRRSLEREVTAPAALVGLRGAFFWDRHDRRIITDGLLGSAG